MQNCPSPFPTIPNYSPCRPSRPCCCLGAEAVKTVDAEKAVGKPHTLWIAFAKLYERHGDLPNARIIFEKAVQVGSGAALHCTALPTIVTLDLH